MNPPHVDQFSCLLLVTDNETNTIEYINQYAYGLLGISVDAKRDIGLNRIMSKATLIFFESYIRPIVAKDGECTEVQITLLDKASDKIPAVANVKRVDSKLYWSIYTAKERDKLYQELLAARENLESQNEALLALTRIDPLTSLLNRRAVVDDLNKLIRQLSRSFIPISFLIIDIDWFKTINDNYGHDVGDEILVELSKEINYVARDTDILARWGGEEFLLILYNSDISNTLLFCQRLHQRINNINLPDNNKLTVSIGVAELKQQDINQDNLLDIVLKRADKALYRAKENGRNRTEV